MLSGAPLQVTSGYNHVCALVDTAAVQCWGSNASKQLGRPTSGRCEDFPCSTTPLTIEGLADPESISAGFAHTCAVTTDDAAVCWGFNLYGQLGDGTQQDSYAPVAVADLHDVAELASGDVHTCALLQDSTVRCWGNNLLGELGNGSLTTDLTPTVVCDVLCKRPLDQIVQMSSGDHHSCALNASGAVFCWGSNVSGQLGIDNASDCGPAVPCSFTPNEVPGLGAPARYVSASTASTCALLEDGSVSCWGREFGADTTSTTPRTIQGWSDVEMIAAGKDHLCAINGDGDVLCLGDNLYGQLGDGTSNDRANGPPARVLLVSRRGDADCDGQISSIDATFMLQHVAGFFPALPCPNATASPGSSISALDALAVLQLSAGLLT